MEYPGRAASLDKGSSRKQSYSHTTWCITWWYRICVRVLLWMQETGWACTLGPWLKREGSWYHVQASPMSRVGANKKQAARRQACYMKHIYRGTHAIAFQDCIKGRELSYGSCGCLVRKRESLLQCMPDLISLLCRRIPIPCHAHPLRPNVAHRWLSCQPQVRILQSHTIRQHLESRLA